MKLEHSIPGSGSVSDCPTEQQYEIKLLVNVAFISCAGLNMVSEVVSLSYLWPVLRMSYECNLSS